MRILIRTFNDHINSKSGAELPIGMKRGTDDWKKFDNILIESLLSLGHEVHSQEESPLIENCPGVWDKIFYVHQCKRDKPDGNFFYQQMHMRELFTLDTDGWGADASNNTFKPGDVNDKEAKVFCQALSAHIHASGTSKIDQVGGTSDTPSNFILVPLQIPRDYTIKHHSPVTVRYFVDSIMSWAEESNTHVCIKMHPHNKMDRDLHQAVEEGTQVSDYVHKVEGNINELIRRSSGLFVINSGTGFEGLIHGKPVATFGDCDYRRVTFNADLRRLDQAREFLYEYEDEWRDIGYQFIYWYYHLHAYDVTKSETKQRLTDYLRSHLL